MTHIAIIGAGMAGLGAAHRLFEKGIQATTYEKNSYVGGHAASFSDQGFVFDDGPHISFTKDARIQRLFAESVRQAYEVIQASTNNYWKGHWIKHPAQCNLYGLPTETVVEVLYDFINARKDAPTDIGNYRDWLYASFGKTFAETFPMQYGRKFHTTTADNMTTDWIGVRLYQANLREILYGALTAHTPDVHYVDHFRYPTRGGFAAFLDIFADRADIKLNHELVRLDVQSRQLTFGNGERAGYDGLVSSIPLPELIPCIEGVPDDVRQAARQLACTTCVIVNIGIDRADLSTSHWTYFYDEAYGFARLSFPHMLSPHNVPPGAGSIQAEIYFSAKYRPLDRAPQDFVQPVIDDLTRCGLITSGDKVIYTNAHLIPYANIIFDLDRPRALAKVHRYLNDIGVWVCGRYGEWGYHWTDESFLSGEKAAENALQHSTSGSDS